MAVIRSPARTRPGSLLKRSFRAEQAGVIPPSIAKSLFALPANLASPGPAPVSQRKTLRRRRVIPDGGYSHPMEKSGSFSTISDPDFHASSTEEEGSLESDENIRCICGADRDGGTLMVQCWLHLKCTGLNKKALPETYNCLFCSRENQPPSKPRSVCMGGGSFRGTPAPTIPGSPIKRRMC
ncbi:hypothetical protein BGX38DRAFT_126707 [Terfezia claveryi]|nr:hypothetical protein BGX38DRAFT_126707 [Terfezia claveryi]